MAEFSIERPLPSILVSKDLLESLEKYLTSQLARDTADAPSAPEIKIVVTDSSGDETVRSVEELPYTRFPDSTSRVRVSAETALSKVEPRIRCNISFAKSRLFTSFSIRVSGGNAREVAIGIADGLLRIAQPHTTYHWLYNPIVGIEAALWGGLFGLIWLAVSPWPNAITRAISAVTWLVCFVYLYVAKPLHPYSAFDSGKLERFSTFWNWLIYGLLTFLVFGTAATYFRRSALGF